MARSDTSGSGDSGAVEGGLPRHRPFERARWLATLRGALEALVVVSAFVGVGLTGAAVQGAAPPGSAPYAPAVAEPGDPTNATSPAPRWLVDGFNVLCTGLLGGRDRSDWWSGERRGELLALAEDLDERNAEVWVVFDGPLASPLDAGAQRARPVFAPSADAWMLDQLRSRAAPAGVTVVTADRQLAGRARHRGARVISPREFLARCGHAAKAEPGSTS